MRLTRVAVSAIALAALSLLLSTCRLDSLFQSRDPVIEITLPGDTVVAVQDSLGLTPSVTIDGREPSKPLPLRWLSSNPDVASVDALSGRVRGLARGKTVISVRLAESALGTSNAEGQDTVRVIAASVTLAPGDTSMQSVGDTLCYRATARDAADSTIAGVTPDVRIAADPEATVELAGAPGCVTALKNGAAATIEASLDTSTVTGTLTVRQHVTSLDIQEDRDTLFGVGVTATYPAAVRDARGNLAPLATIGWTSSDTGVVNVDAAGQVTTQGEGTAYVRASADDGADSVQVTVTPPRLVVSHDTARATASEGNTNPRAVKVAIANSGTGSVTWTATGAGDWLSLSKTSGTAPDTVIFTFEPTDLAAGTHARSVVITAPGAAGSPHTVEAVFVIAAATAPAAPAELAQFKTDNTTAVGVGGSTEETAIVFKAQLADLDEDASLVLEVEVQPLGTAFTNAATASSATVASGQTASATVTGLVENTDYHWQARVRDETGRASPWANFGFNTEAERDFRMAIPEDPLAPVGLGQFQSDGATAMAVGAQATATTVVFKGMLSDPDPGDQLRLEVELKRVGTAYDGAGTVLSAEVGTGTEAIVTISGIPDDANYHWRARAVDQLGRAGPWVSFGGNTDVTQQDFNVPPLAENPDVPTDPAQFQSDGTTAIAVGGIAFQSTVVLKGRLTDADPGDQLTLEAEVRPVGTAFTNVATHTSTAVASGGVGSITVSDLSEDTEYHWQFRAVDQTLRASSWSSFGANAESAADFHVALPEPPNAPTGLGQFRGSNDAVISLGTTIDERTVVFKATVTDPDPGDQIRLEVEIKPLGTAFDDAGTTLGAAVASGAVASATVAGQGDDTSYHWRVRTVDQTNRTSAWVPFGANAEGAIDYRIVVPEPPSAASLAQFKSNGTTAIADGATTDQATVVLQAVIIDPDPGDQVQLDVEVRPVAQSFTSTPTHSGALGAGGTVQLSVSGLSDNTDYHWRARARDQAVAASAWVSFGGSDGTTDFRVAVPQDPGAPSGLGQFQTDATTPVAVGATTTENTVVFKATVTDPDPGDQLRLEVEVQPVGTAFTDAPTAAGGTAVSSGQVASVSVGPLSDNTDYHWQARIIDQGGRINGWVQFGSNNENESDFRVDVPGSPDAPTGLAQYRGDGTTPIASGATIDEKTVVFKATASDPDLLDQVRLQVEVRSTSSGFTGAVTATGPLVDNGSTASVTASNLGDDTNYHWQLRTVDEHGNASAWVPFPPSPGTDFRVQVPETPGAPGDPGQFKSDGSTAISVGASTDETTFVLKAMVTDPDPGDQLTLEVEVKPVGTAFDSTGTLTSSTVTTGTLATVTVSGLTDDTDYHWRLRVFDQTGQSNGWVGFGGNADSPLPAAADFRVAIPQAPSLPADSGQFKSNGSTAIVVGATTDENTVVLKARLTDPDPGDQLRLEIEVKRVGVAFDSVGTLTSAAVASGSFASVTVSGLADDTTYHWRLRAIDQSGRASAWIGFGNNLESAVDFRVAVPQPPLDPTSLAQFKSDGTTPIATGGTTDQTTVVLKATVTDPDPGSTIRLEVEVKAIGTAFDGTGTAVGAVGVAAGGTAAVAVTVPDNARYHWQARARDQSNSLSAWVPFGGNAETAADFIVDVLAQPPGVPTALGQFKSNGTTPILVGTTTDEDIVVFKATVADPDPGAQIRLEVERQPLGTPFANTPTATGTTAVASGQVAIVTVDVHTDQTSYHWQARAIDQNNNTSGWVSFGLPNAETDIDYQVKVQGPPPDPDPASLAQFKSDEITSISTGGTADQNTVVFKATNLTDSPPAQMVRLEVEVKPVAVAFNGTGTDTSAAVTSGSPAQLTKSGLGDDTNYHWRARTLAGATRVSGWVSFGGNADGVTDFRVAVPENPHVPADSALRQLRSFGNGPAIAVGGATESDSLVFRARLTDPDAGDSVRFQAEWKLVGVAFDSLGTAMSPKVASGDTAVVTVVGLVEDASYHWRVKAWDQTGRQSSWVSFGGNSDPNGVDFRRATPQAPSAPISPAQLRSDSATGIGLAEVITDTVVVFRAGVSDPDPGDQVQLWVEVRPVGEAFQNVATHTGAFTSGATAYVRVGTHTDNTHYHWQMQVVDQTGRRSGWVKFGGNGEDQADYTVNSVLQDPSPVPSNPGQFQSNGTTAIAVDGEATGGALEVTVVFKATVFDLDPRDSLTIQIEARQVGTALNGTATHNGTAKVANNGIATLTATFARPAALVGPTFFFYHWAVRACDQTGRCSGWTQFGNNTDGASDFRVARAVL